MIPTASVQRSARQEFLSFWTPPPLLADDVLALERVPVPRGEVAAQVGHSRHRLDAEVAVLGSFATVEPSRIGCNHSGQADLRRAAGAGTSPIRLYDPRTGR